jgi:uncharacterized membrane protein
MGRITHLIVWASILFVPLALRAGLITSLGVFDGHTHSAATDVNDAGVVVGVSFFSDQSTANAPTANRAFRYTGSGPLQPLTPVGTTSVATAINNAGVIVGWSSGTISGGGFGFHWTSPGPVQNFPIAGEANSINDGGVIVGYLGQFGVPQHAFRYDGTGGTQQDLGVIAGTRSYAHDINEAGVIVGYSNINTTALRKAARYVNGAWSAIPGLSNFTDSEARAINESGDIVGTVGTSGGFRFNNAAGTIVALAGDAADINDAGFVVGSMNGHAALWRPNNTVVDLDAWLDATSPAEGALFTLQRANAINNHGLIVGNAGGGGAQGAFRLDASALVPEPAAISLLLAAAGLLVRRRRR